MKYKINFKEPGRDWRFTYYESPIPTSDAYLIEFFGLTDCEDFKIEKL